MEPVTVDVNKNDVIITTEERRAKFFAALTTEPRTFTELRERTRRYGWFGEVLAAYLRIISDKLEELLPDVDDDTHVAFTNWVLLQGHDAVQALLLETPATFVDNKAYQDASGLKRADAFWYRV